MRQVIKLSVIIAFIAILAGCKKNNEERVNESLVSGKLQDAVNQDKCRLQSIQWNDGSYLSFTYNSSGLVEDFIEYYGDVIFNRYTYDENGRAISSVFHLSGDAINMNYYYTGKLLTRTTGHLESTGELWNDIYYGYDEKGEIISLDDEASDIHTKFYYNPQGYATTIELYIGDELIYLLHYRYDIPNRNPFLALRGLNIWHTNYIAPIFDQRWESGFDLTYYENGVPYLINDYDPASIIMQTGNQNYLTYTSFFDRSPYVDAAGDITMTYENCGGNGGVNRNLTGSGKISGALSFKQGLMRILSHRSKNLRQDLKELHRQWKSQVIK
ncbi:MAG TPA: hypothetical protein VGD17_16185 [Chitinophagaceae bacterium]